MPPGLKGDARDVYLEEVRKQVKTLLQKAIAIHEKNHLMAERVGEKNQWVQRSNEQMEQLKKLLTPGPVAPVPVAGALMPWVPPPRRPPPPSPW